ncbi:MAG: hypothetical protein JOS17DRAFT_757012 [Linnemannia elongata]|nr:MAG: hypothetical protein JOS17DRAFT_757012 [Linnemannia elongata]
MVVHLCLFVIICLLYYLSHFRFRPSLHANVNGNVPQLFCHAHLFSFSIFFCFVL